MRFLSLRSIRASSDLHLSLRVGIALSPRSNPEGGGFPAQPLDGGVVAWNKGSDCVVVVVCVLVIFVVQVVSIGVVVVFVMVEVRGVVV